MNRILFLLACVLLSSLGGGAVAQEFNPYGMLSGFYACQARQETICMPQYSAASQITGSSSELALIERVDGQVNRSIRYESDLQHYHVGDYWTVPTDGYGDCEDYMLAKKAALEKAGFPSGALRPAIVLVSETIPEGTVIVPHAVLLVVTSRGTYILDSPIDIDEPGHADELRTMQDARDYQFITVQDQNGRWKDPRDRQLALNN